MKRRFFIFVLPLSLLAALSAGRSWWSLVEELSSEKYEGRATASEGYRKAAEFVAGQFKNLGLKPAAGSGYLLPVRFQVRRIREAESSLKLVRGGIQEWLELGEDAYFTLNAGAGGTIRAPAVFVGYGLTVPERNYDDLAGLDLKGKIAVFLRGGPASIPGPLRAHYQSGAERTAFLRKAGVIGTVSILDPKTMDVPWERLRLVRLEPFFSLKDVPAGEAAGLNLAVTVNPDKAERWFAGSGHSFEEILKLAGEGLPLPRFPLAYEVQAEVALDGSTAQCANVAAVIPGRDSRLRNEYVVLSAHLDHLGISEAGGNRTFFPGAMDNAAGVASLIEVARQLRRAPPRRSVLFAAFTGEEKGLLGSRHFAASPPVPLSSIVADLNLDMFLPLHELRWLTVYGLEESSLGRDAEAVARSLGIKVQADPQPERNIFIRSDQYNFIRAGIPALSFRFGFEKGSPEEQLHRDWLRARYHGSADDPSQPVNLDAAARFNRFIAALVARVANSSSRPAWNPESFFRRFAR